MKRVCGGLCPSVVGECRKAAERLYDFVCRNHVQQDGSLLGPDAGLRWNLRVWRFAKSYFPFLPWKDEPRYLLQAQGYWILTNSAWHRLEGADRYREAAMRCADVVVTRQTAEGCWMYDNPDWSGRVVTVEGCFAALGLIAAYELSKDQKYLDAAVGWHTYMMSTMGFQKVGPNSLALNYFAGRPSGPVPNNSTLGMWLLAELSNALGDSGYLNNTREMLRFVRDSQLESGELPYAFGGGYRSDKVHYLCFQYHAFQFLDVARYYELTGNDEALPVLQRIAGFLACGLMPNGDARCSCQQDRPTVHYYTAAVAAALLKATEMGIGDYHDQAANAYRRLISWQRSDGGFDYSARNYVVLSDRRSYPRPTMMLLKHLILPLELHAESGNTKVCAPR